MTRPKMSIFSISIEPSGLTSVFQKIASTFPYFDLHFYQGSLSRLDLLLELATLPQIKPDESPHSPWL